MQSLIKNLDWRAYLAEFLGTFVFVFLASCAVITNGIYGEVGSLGIALATGLILSAMIFATVHVSGGHLNPAVTLALWLTQKINTINGVFYILAQLGASLAAAGSLLFLFGQKAIALSLGGPGIVTGVDPQLAVVLEAIFTAVLVFAVFATIVDRRGPGSFGPLVIGLVVVCASIAIGPVTGAALNPARAFGPLVLTQQFDALAVYIIGPLCGALIGFVYEYAFLRSSKKIPKSS